MDPLIFILGMIIVAVMFLFELKRLIRNTRLLKIAVKALLSSSKNTHESDSDNSESA